MFKHQVAPRLNLNHQHKPPPAVTPQEDHHGTPLHFSTLIMLPRVASEAWTHSEGHDGMLNTHSRLS
ncbi:hypothetical protein E2C01_089499 [Portunus trituberculatus]|uniref:Uncharacterized protein n=1 Tax=Portunus trituberculatus TaxID=210409 RepID=A0A5B7JID5_PORTR|nr:hypothetical protein [Portunus trituberculatus]